MNNIADLAVSYWRLSMWVENVNVERKTAATSSLRQIKQYLDGCGIEIRDYSGQRYDPGLAIDVVGVVSGDDLPEEELLIAETLVPLILQDGEIIKYGQVMLGIEEKTAIGNSKLPPDPEKAISILINNIGQYCHAKYRDDKIRNKLRWCKVKLEKQLRAIKKGIR